MVLIKIRQTDLKIGQYKNLYSQIETISHSVYITCVLNTKKSGNNEMVLLSTQNTWFVLLENKTYSSENQPI